MKVFFFSFFFSKISAIRSSGAFEAGGSDLFSSKNQRF
jgi:hypothetical protein